jgi:hypothetical protein
MKMVYVVDLTSEEETGLLELVGTGGFVMLSGVHRGRVHTGLRGARERSGIETRGGDGGCAPWCGRCPREPGASLSNEIILMRN